MSGTVQKTMQMIPAFQFTLNQHDTLLVLKALGGRLTADNEQEARELGDRLTRERVEALEQTAKKLRSALSPV